MCPPCRSLARASALGLIMPRHCQATRVRIESPTTSVSGRMELAMFEPHTRPPLTQRAFLKRMIRHGGYGLWLLSGSLCLGIAGYHWIARFSWVDAFLNA